MTIDASTATLSDIKLEIQHLNCNNGPFSHNMVGLLLGVVDERFGEDEANRLILDLGITL